MVTTEARLSLSQLVGTIRELHPGVYVDLVLQENGVGSLAIANPYNPDELHVFAFRVDDWHGLIHDVIAWHNTLVLDGKL